MPQRRATAFIGAARRRHLGRAGRERRPDGGLRLHARSGAARAANPDLHSPQRGGQRGPVRRHCAAARGGSAPAGGAFRGIATAQLLPGYRRWGSRAAGSQPAGRHLRRAGRGGQHVQSPPGGAGPARSQLHLPNAGPQLRHRGANPGGAGNGQRVRAPARRHAHLRRCGPAAPARRARGRHLGRAGRERQPGGGLRLHAFGDALWPANPHLHRPQRRPLRRRGPAPGAGRCPGAGHHCAPAPGQHLLPQQRPAHAGGHPGGRHVQWPRHPQRQRV